MTPAARIQAVIEILGQILSEPRPADGIASAYFRNRRFIGSKDRAAINQRLYRIMRRYHRLGWWITRNKMAIDARSLVIADWMIEKEGDAQALVTLFSGGTYAPPETTKDERALAKALQGRELAPAEMPLRERVECPEWAWPGLLAALGEDGVEKELAAMLGQAPLDLRVNTIKSSRDAALKQLQDDGFDAHAGKIAPDAIRVFGRPQILQHPLYRDGVIEIQDEGSQMVAIAADPKPGQQVADFCAGAGGKTLALGAIMNNKGRIVAMDVSAGRLQGAKERFKRAGLHNIETRELTSERDKYVKRHVGYFDVLLIDAPCSGTGTWRRDPDKRFRQLGPNLPELVALQKNILDSASRMVKPGGRMVYATCSLLPEENETQVQDFLAAHNDFTLLPAHTQPGLNAQGDYLKLSPATHDTDGFFAAVLQRGGEARVRPTEDRRRKDLDADADNAEDEAGAEDDAA